MWYIGDPPKKANSEWMITTIRANPALQPFASLLISRVLHTNAVHRAPRLSITSITTHMWISTNLKTATSVIIINAEVCIQSPSSIRSASISSVRPSFHLTTRTKIGLYTDNANSEMTRWYRIPPCTFKLRDGQKQLDHCFQERRVRQGFPFKSSLLSTCCP